MSSHLLPRLVFLGPCLILLGTLSLASGGGTGLHRPEPASAAPLAHRPQPTPAAPIVTAREFQTEFEVRARLLCFSVSRDISVRARLHGLDGFLEVTLDREVKPMFGVEGMAVTLRILDERGHEVDIIETDVPARTKQFRVPLSLPDSGCYELVLADDDLTADPARVSIEPSGEVRMPIRAVAALHSEPLQAALSCAEGAGPVLR